MEKTASNNSNNAKYVFLYKDGSKYYYIDIHHNIWLIEENIQSGGYIKNKITKKYIKNKR